MTPENGCWYGEARRHMRRYRAGRGATVTNYRPSPGCLSLMLRPCPRITMLAALLLGCAACSRVASEPHAAVSTGELRLVYAEREGGSTSIWAARPADPADRRLIARVSHDPEWGIRASLSSDGRTLAYTAMPPGARDPDKDAVLAVLDLTQRRSQRLATGLDLRTTPLWMGESGALLVQRRTATGAGALAEVEADGRERGLLTARSGHRLFPIGVDRRSGRLYVVAIAEGEARLTARGEDGLWQDLGRLAAGAARGFVLTPDGSAVGYLRLDRTGGDARYRAHVFDTATGALSPLQPDRERLEDTAVLWSPAGGWVVTSLTSGGAGVLLAPPPASEQRRPDGFDAAVLVSPDGRWTVLRSFEGSDTRTPGAEALEVMDSEGRRARITGGGATALGWVGG